VVLGITAAVMCTTLVAGLLAEIHRAMAYLAYAGVLLIAVYVMRRFVVEYRYAITKKGEFVVARIMGGRVREVLRAELAEIEHYGDVSAVPASAKTRRFLLEKEDAGVRALVLSDGEELTAVHIKPDEEMDRLLVGFFDGSIGPDDEDTAGCAEEVDEAAKDGEAEPMPEESGEEKPG